MFLYVGHLMDNALFLTIAFVWKNSWLDKIKVENKNLFRKLTES